MRTVNPFRPLLLAAVLLAAACGDESDFTAPDSPPPAEVELPDPESAGPLEDLAYWADGYLFADQPTRSSYAPLPSTSFNRSGGTMSITKVAGTTGRYIARFKGLSALTGTRNAVRTTASGSDASYCKPVGAFLVRDSVEVRCFRMGTGAAVDATFFLQVVAKRDDRAFAFGNQPAATSYTPPSNGTWNPAGATRIYRDGVGQYRVVFSGLGARLSSGVAGHVQVNGVGTNKPYCKVLNWGGSPDLIVLVRCYGAAGGPADARFTVQFSQPAAHLAYAWAGLPTTTLYQPSPAYASNPVGGAMYIQRNNVGRYEIGWTGASAEIRGYGSPQVTAFSEGNAQCKVIGIDEDYVEVQCFAANGEPRDTYFVVQLAS